MASTDIMETLNYDKAYKLYVHCPEGYVTVPRRGAGSEKRFKCVKLEALPKFLKMGEWPIIVVTDRKFADGILVNRANLNSNEVTLDILLTAANGLERCQKTPIDKKYLVHVRAKKDKSRASTPRKSRRAPTASTDSRGRSASPLTARSKPARGRRSPARSISKGSTASRGTSVGSRGSRGTSVGSRGSRGTSVGSRGSRGSSVGSRGSRGGRSTASNGSHHHMTTRSRAGSRG